MIKIVSLFAILLFSASAIFAQSALDGFNPNPDGPIRAVVVQADGKILVGGEFGSIGGVTRVQLARLDAATGLADSFNPSPDGTVNSIVVRADGGFLVAGGFNNIGGQARLHLARLNSTSGLADTLNPDPGGPLSAIAMQADGKGIVSGAFLTVAGQLRGFIARVNGVSGQSITVSVRSKIYQFDPRLVTTVSDLSDVDFVPTAGPAGAPLSPALRR